MQFKFQCIQRISFIPSTVKIGLKKCLCEIGLKGQLLEGQCIDWLFSSGYIGGNCYLEPCVNVRFWTIFRVTWF